MGQAESTESWGDKLISRIMGGSILSLSGIIVVTIVTALIAWYIGSPILETVLQVLGIAALILFMLAMVALIEFLTNNDMDGTPHG